MVMRGGKAGRLQLFNITAVVTSDVVGKLVDFFSLTVMQ
jgi:hypothetical protein